MTSLQKEIREEIPIVGLEPSCVAVFRDELVNLFPNDEDAKRLNKQVFTLAEFLQKKAPDFKVPEFRARAMVHTHCHHKAIMSTESDVALFKRMKLDYQLLDSGCCGMAGYFGYEAGNHYAVGLSAGERVLLPAVRKASSQTLIISDGFSCREQIGQGTDRKGLHTAQLLQMALKNEDISSSYPERKYMNAMKLKNTQRKKKLALRVLGLYAAAVVIVITRAYLTRKARL